MGEHKFLIGAQNLGEAREYRLRGVVGRGGPLVYVYGTVAQHDEIGECTTGINGYHGHLSRAHERTSYPGQTAGESGHDVSCALRERAEVLGYRLCP